MNKRSIIITLLVLIATTGMGQGRYFLADGVRGKDLAERLQFIQAFTPLSDTCLVMTDSLGRFEIDPLVMEKIQGNIYLKPLIKKTKAKLAIENPFDSIDYYQRGRQRYLPQNYFYEVDNSEHDVIDGFGTVMLKDIYVTAKRQSPYRDKVMGSLDSLAILASGEWVCNCKADGTNGYLNDYHGYSHHPEGYYPPKPDLKRRLPKRGEIYRLIKYEPGGPNGKWLLKMDPYNIVYHGPQYTEDDLLKMYGLSKAQGYYPHREFYEPDPVEHSPTMPDPRNTLLWKPDIQTDENGKAEVSFVNSDVNTEYIGIVEAVDGTGLLGYHTFTFRVIKNK